MKKKKTTAVDKSSKSIEKKPDDKLLQKIINGRLSETQELGTLFRPLALCPLPAQPLPKKEVIKKGKRDEEHETYWTRKAGNFRIELIGHQKYGLPYGQDILIILYLAVEAKKQGSRTITVNFYRDFMKMFDMNPNDGSKYRLVQKSLQRIRQSMFSWGDETKKSRERGKNYLYIDDWDLYFDPKNPDQRPLFNQFIKLSERFWKEINEFDIPFNMDAVRYLRRKPAHLNFYIWLSFRVWYAYQSGESKVYIPFWGNNGLQYQMSSRIENKVDYRKQVRKYMKSIKAVWPLCPVEIESDILKIDVNNPLQLDIQEKPVQKVLNFSKSKELEPGKEETPADQPAPDKAAEVATTKKYEADFRFYGAKGQKLKEALAHSPERIEANLTYFKGYLERMKAAGRPVRNPGALLCAAVIDNYAEKSPLVMEQEKKKAAKQEEADKYRQEIELTKQKKNEFNALKTQKIKDGLAAMPGKEREKLEADFVDLATQQPVFAEAYRKRGLRDRTIKSIYLSFMGDKFLTEEEQDFEAWMTAQGLEIVEE